MLDQFSKLTIDTDLRHVDMASRDLHDQYLKTPSSSNSNLHRSPSSSSQYTNINADLQARVKAFQEQRALKRSASVKSNRSIPESLESSISSHNLQNKQVPFDLNMDTQFEVSVNDSSMCLSPQSNKSSLISLTDSYNLVKAGANNSESSIDFELSPHYTRETIATLEDEDNIIEPHIMQNIVAKQLNPSRIAPKKPASNQDSLKETANSPIDPKKQLQSLSARRGLKLPLDKLSLTLLNKSSTGNQTQGQDSNFQLASNQSVISRSNFVNSNANVGSSQNGIQITSTSSSNLKKSNDEDGFNKNDSTVKTKSKTLSGVPSGLFANFAKYIDVKSGSLNFAGKLSLSSKGINFSNGGSSNISIDELEFLGELGNGNYGTVSKVLHKPTNVIMAVKEVRLELDESKFRQILMELEVLHKCNSPYIVDFYGAFFVEGAVYMCMEYMDGGSLDKIYDSSKEVGGIDEPQLAYITESVVRGLMELKDKHNVIHRDVKPTNILCSASQGTIKLCDFGVSGNLVASLAKTNIGCQSYMAPERIRSANPDMNTYSVQSDIWSLGLSILEMALGSYPYPPETYDNIFSQLSAIVDGPPPNLPQDRFSKEAQDFVSLCLQKVPERRPTYTSLLRHPWLMKYRTENYKISNYISDRLDKKKNDLNEIDSTKPQPALHRGGL
ncbi:hypothetical protein Kpol_448p13 [Vanderwaltozyma polyspora DSM 70294]|uniref:mitogen-activated protein kinase kinase n=1 Tax=Vanderwaltozyma polyspora (strain ATCC 22028 / DSM 70294 / BCRC 21397 / CBS 2163 / NBRC 10782 / NRRL Y-8283 / UCD 57-17) TaxID=436907 RepID=A7TQY8_VANPO|nr:uncharacterized protein Kpol_448p13 [Vanderwaltozyma polyspora DSM 70294]EDO15325.1 hypothetical protein Kpol_448p13 [Vanderwaltozyma polyspora DSM 70294]